MGRRPPPRKIKRRARESVAPKKSELKSIVLLGRLGALKLAEQLERVRKDLEGVEQHEWDRTPLGELLQTMKSGS